MKLQSANVKRVSAISPVWIIPLVALFIAAWLAVRSWQQQGTEIEIIFDSASGIEVGKTQIRLKDVPVGKVTKVRLSPDLSKVRVFAMLDSQVSNHLSVNSRFWIVEPSVSANGISNLGTLISGVFIVMDPGDKGQFHQVFEGLTSPPAIESDEKGKQYTLNAATLGSIGIGSPVYYRELKVGEVTSYKLADQGNSVEIRLFIEAPHDHLVLTKSRFWNVSGLNVSVGAEGVKAQMASLSSLVGGGIAFDNAAGFESPVRADNNYHFYLYEDRDSVLEQRYTLKYYYRFKFSHSMKGLSVGAPIEFRGMKVGEVMDVVLDTVDDSPHSLHVFASMEPQRLDTDSEPTREEFDHLMQSLVAKGMRASLKTASIITGAKYIDLNFPAEPSAGQVVVAENFTDLPTQDSASGDLDVQLAQIAQKMNSIPIERIGNDLSGAISGLNAMMTTLKEQNTASKIDKLLGNVEQASYGLGDTLQETEHALKNLSQAMKSVDATFASDSSTQYELGEMINSMNATLESLNRLVDKLNSKPEALIFGD